MRKVCRLNLWENLFCSNFLSQGESVHLFIIASAMIKRTRANSPPIAVQRTSAHFLSFSRLGGDGTFDREFIKISKFLFKHFVDKVYYKMNKCLLISAVSEISQFYSYIEQNWFKKLSTDFSEEPLIYPILLYLPKIQFFFILSLLFLFLQFHPQSIHYQPFFFFISCMFFFKVIK